MAESSLFTVADADVRPGRIQKDIRGTGERPRLCVYRSNKHIYAQLINDNTAHTLVQASSVEDEIRKEADDKSQQEISKLVGQRLAEKAEEEGISKAVFDRNNYRYHGRVKALAEGAREGGLSF